MLDDYLKIGRAKLWARAWLNQQNDMRAQWRFGSTWASLLSAWRRFGHREDWSDCTSVQISLVGFSLLQLMFIMLLFSTGDDVFVKSDQEKPAIYRIEKLWIDARYVDIWLAILITCKNWIKVIKTMVCGTFQVCQKWGDLVRDLQLINQ